MLAVARTCRVGYYTPARALPRNYKKGRSIMADTYDLTQLTEDKGIDRNLVKLFFFDNHDYFDAMTDFIAHFGHPLAQYTPAFVVNSPSDRALFMDDCLKIRSTLMQLGLSFALHELDIMENAIWDKNVKEFADGQVKFAASVEIYREIMRGALVGRY
jgi:hypothetical protein